jgi:hypothetical protein
LHYDGLAQLHTLITDENVIRSSNQLPYLPLALAAEAAVQAFGQKTEAAEKAVGAASASGS